MTYRQWVEIYAPERIAKNGSIYGCPLDKDVWHCESSMCDICWEREMPDTAHIPSKLSPKEIENIVRKIVMAIYH